LFLLPIFLLADLLIAQTTDKNLQSPFITNLYSEIENDSVILNWQDTADIDDMIYEIRRYGEEITVNNLQNTYLVARVAPGIRTYTDHPENGSWWYCIVSIKNGKAVNLIVPWRNALGSPVIIGPDYAAPEQVNIMEDETLVFNLPSIRPAPLPLIEMGSIIEKTALSNQAESVLNALLNPVSGELWVQEKPEKLSMDRRIEDKESLLILKSIIGGSFADNNWQEAESELVKLSASINLEKNLKDAIMFYKGECQYFQYNLHGAFLSFLTASDSYYTESRRWMYLIYKDLTPVF